jgi:hypothetical protein
MEHLFPVCFDMRSLAEERGDAARIVIWLRSGTTTNDVKKWLNKYRRNKGALSYWVDGEELAGNQPLLGPGTIQVRGPQG